MGFLHTPEPAALLEDTPKLSDLDLADHDAILVSGGQSPVFTYLDHPGLADAVRTMYEAEKPAAA